MRRGDFTHRISIRARDQLGELAASFNSMTASVEDLLRIGRELLAPTLNRKLIEQAMSGEKENYEL